MNVHPATKNGFLLKKPSIASKIDSRLTLSETWSVEETTASEAKQGREVRRLITVKESWAFVRFGTNGDVSRSKGLFWKLILQVKGSWAFREVKMGMVMEFRRGEMGLEMAGLWVLRWLWEMGGQEERTVERDSMITTWREPEKSGEREILKGRERDSNFNAFDMFQLWVG